MSMNSRNRAWQGAYADKGELASEASRRPTHLYVTKGGTYSMRLSGRTMASIS